MRLRVRGGSPFYCDTEFAVGMGQARKYGFWKTLLLNIRYWCRSPKYLIPEFIGTNEILKRIAVLKKAEAQHYRDSDRGLGALRDAEERHYLDLQHGQQEMEQKIDLLGAQLVVGTQNQTAQLSAINKVVESLEHLINLVEPKAARLRAGAPIVLDWDEVQRQNAAQELENNDGQPVRR
jgi:hypothetical protein